LNLGGSKLDIKEMFEIQRDFDRKMGWNRYEKCETTEEILNFIQHFVLVMVEELGEFSRVRKEFFRDEKDFDKGALKHELVDMFVYLMQACMALNMDLEEEYWRKMRNNEERFIRKRQS